MKLSQSDIGYPLICRVERILKKSVGTVNFAPEFREQEFKPPPHYFSKTQYFSFKTS